MRLKHRHITHHHTKTVNRKNQLTLLVVAIIILALGVGTLTYFRGSHGAAVTKLPVHFTDTFGDTFDAKPISAFPPELILPGVTVQQYFDNATYSGILFKTSENFAQVKASYQTALAGTTWSAMTAPSSKVSEPDVLSFVNQQTKKNARVTLKAGASNMTIVIVAAQK